MAENRFYIESSPHFSMNLSTQKIMLSVIIALLPECIYGVVIFGFSALAVIFTGVLSCVLFELLFQLATRQKLLIRDLSAVVSGILLALVCPSTVPLWIVVLGGAVAMIVAKGLFGGIGANVFNPALTGRAVLFLSFPVSMGAKWYEPTLVPRIYEEIMEKSLSLQNMDAMANATVWDGITAATSLSAIKRGQLSADSFTWLSFFWGNRAGCIGETSVFFIAISFVFLLALRIIDWRATFSMLGTFYLATFILVFAKTSDALDAFKNVGMGLLTGGIVFGSVFMVTDYATTPVTAPGRLVFGFGCGLITFLIRNFGGYPEGVMFSILIMNAFSPFLNNLTVRMYGYGKKGNRRLNSKKIDMEFNIGKNPEVSDCQKGGSND